MLFPWFLVKTYVNVYKKFSKKKKHKKNIFLSVDLLFKTAHIVLKYCKYCDQLKNHDKLNYLIKYDVLILFACDLYPAPILLK